jgi:CRP-like cAMP-binding protein
MPHSKIIKIANHQSCHNCGLKLENIICSASPEVLKILDEAKVTCRFKPGQFIFYVGNIPLGIFSISKGFVKLEVDSLSGHSHTLRIIGPGGVLGYRSLFAEEPYQSSAIAMEEVELCFIPKADVQAIFKEHPEVAMRLLGHLSKDLRQADTKWMDQMDKGATERVAEAVLFLQEHFTRTQAWTRRDIAQWAGTTPETVMRALAQLEKEGLIDQSDSRQILVLDRDKLKERYLFIK